jgi:hypothetical protein
VNLLSLTNGGCRVTNPPLLLPSIHITVELRCAHRMSAAIHGFHKLCTVLYCLHTCIFVDIPNSCYRLSVLSVLWLIIVYTRWAQVPTSPAIGGLTCRPNDHRSPLNLPLQWCHISRYFVFSILFFFSFFCNIIGTANAVLSSPFPTPFHLKGEGGGKNRRTVQKLQLSLWD